VTEIPQELVAILATAGLSALTVAVERAHRRVVEALHNLRDRIPDKIDAPAVDQNWIARIESLEMRMSTLHDECRRFLQRGESTLSRARKLKGDLPDDYEPTDEEAEEAREAIAAAAAAHGAPAAPPASNGAGRKAGREPVIAARYRR